jgi:hypothetical protein
VGICHPGEYYWIKSFNISEPNATNTLTGHQKWDIDFWDKHSGLHPVRCVRPPNADEDWYTDEILRQLQEE